MATTTSGSSALALLAAELTAAHLAAGVPQARPAPRISYSAPLRSLLDSARRAPAPDLAQRYGPQPGGRRAHRRDAGYGGVPAIFGRHGLRPRRLLWRR